MVRHVERGTGFPQGTGGGEALREDGAPQPRHEAQLDPGNCADKILPIARSCRTVGTLGASVQAATYGRSRAFRSIRNARDIRVTMATRAAPAIASRA